MMAYEQAIADLDLNELLKDVDLNVLLKQLDLNKLLDVYDVTELLTDEQISKHFDGMDLAAIKQTMKGFSGNFIRGGQGGRGGMDGGFPGGGPRMLESSSDTATVDFVLTKETSGFTNVIAAEK